MLPGRKRARTGGTDTLQPGGCRISGIDQGSFVTRLSNTGCQALPSSDISHLPA
jgi:hypothetical protein